MTDRYRPPSAPLADPAERARRPIWVWILSIYYGLSAVVSTLSWGAVVSGAIEPLPEQAVLFENTGVLDALMVGTSALVVLVFAIQLFRLRSSAVTLALISLLLGVVAAARQFTDVERVRALGGVGFFSLVFGLIISFIVYRYAVSLRRRGILTDSKSLAA